MTPREREMLERIKARAKTLGQAAAHYKVPGDEPLTVLALLYMAIKIQGGDADEAVLHGPVQCLIKIADLMGKQAEGVPMGSPEQGPITLTQEQLHLLMHTAEGNGKNRKH